MSRAFITGKTAIDSMRDNGYRNTAYAIAELIDNSIQAGANRVDLICMEINKPSENSGRRIKKVDEIIILDNGSGMSSEILHLALEFGASENRLDSDGMGKFGMGLPNSSISQCKRVEVWSWTSPGKYNFTYLDIDEMKSGSLEVIPEVSFNEIPDNIYDALPEGVVPDSGTLIKWSKLDRLVWTTSKSILRHSEDMVGRMYRHFINKGKSNIYFHSKVKGIKTDTKPIKFKANDPLYLSRNTSLPELPGMYHEETFFELVDEVPVDIEYGGKHYIVKITASAVKKSIFDFIRANRGQKVGGTEWGKHCSKNNGISIVRADRELELKPEFIPYKIRDKGRFMGIEVSFPPALDVVFGVTNNKQQAVNFNPMSIDEDAEREGYESDPSASALSQYKAELSENNDPKLLIYKIVNAVENLIDKVNDEYFKKISFGNVIKDSKSNSLIKMAKAATEAANDRIDKGHGVQSDDDTPTFDDAKKLFMEQGDSTEDAESKAKIVIDENLKFYIESKELVGDVFFDVSQKAGLSLLLINKNHKFYSRIMGEIDEMEQNMLTLTLAAWARMENEASLNNKEKLRSFRMRWGEMLQEFLPEIDDV